MVIKTHTETPKISDSNIVKPEWATNIRIDKYGYYVELEIRGVVQCFRWIFPGSFQMGSPKSEIGREDDEIQHQVNLTQGYWLADTVCTQAFWQAIMNDNPAYFKDNINNPVECVSWHHVQQFIASLNGFNSSLRVRLPTEAQWEYACRASTATPFACGENITPELVNYDGNNPYANGKKGLYRGKTIPVKSLPPNQWGLYEMHGNVWEWCQDWHGDYSKDSAVDPVGLPSGTDRVLRGGSWADDGGCTRSALRGGDQPSFRNDDMGFRLVLD
jgi:formylglycine-generating enzyme